MARVRIGAPVGEGEADAVGEGEADAVGGGEAGAVAEGEADAVAEGEVDAVAEGEVDAVAEGDAEAVGMEAVGDDAGRAVAVAVGRPRAIVGLVLTTVVAVTNGVPPAAVGITDATVGTTDTVGVGTSPKAWACVVDPPMVTIKKRNTANHRGTADRITRQHHRTDV
jgi:hypothetical protein